MWIRYDDSCLLRQHTLICKNLVFPSKTSLFSRTCFLAGSCGSRYIYIYHNPTTLVHAKLTLVPSGSSGSCGSCGLLIDPLKVSVHQIRLTAWPALRIVIDLSILGYHLQICLISLGNIIYTLHGTFRWRLEPAHWACYRMHRPYAKKRTQTNHP